MPIVHFITHPEVAIDPAVPVPDWPLSERGLRRAANLLTRPWVCRVRAVFSSSERKAAQVAAQGRCRAGGGGSGDGGAGPTC